MLGGPQAEQTLFLKNAQQLGLGLQGEIAHLVKEKRALVGYFNLADAPFLARARKRARRVAEDLGFKEVLGYRRAVDAYERTLGAGTGGMNGTRGQLLAASRGAENEHCRVRAGITQ